MLDDHRDVTTVAGLVTSLIGQFPREGDHARWHGWKFEILDMDGARVDKVLVTPVAPPPEPLGE